MTGKDGHACHGGIMQYVSGETVVPYGSGTQPLVPCVHGLHICSDRQVGKWLGPEIYRVTVPAGQTVIFGHDKTVVSSLVVRDLVTKVTRATLLQIWALEFYAPTASCSNIAAIASWAGLTLRYPTYGTEPHEDIMNYRLGYVASRLFRSVSAMSYTLIHRECAWSRMFHTDKDVPHADYQLETLVEEDAATVKKALYALYQRVAHSQTGTS